MLRILIPALASLLLTTAASAQTLDATAPLPEAGTLASLPAAETPASLEQRVAVLDQKVRVLEARADVAQEVANARNGAGTADGDDLVLRSKSGDLSLQFNGILQADGRLFLNDDARKLTDTFTTRVIRPVFSGAFGKLLRWQFTPDFAGGVVTIQDAWVDLVLGDHVTVRVGKMTVPFGLERWQGTAALRFIERAYPTQLSPNRDVGILIFGDLLQKRIGWSLGAYDGGIDNSLTDTDNNDSKDVVGRIFAQPFATLENPWLSSLLIGGAFSWGEQNGTDSTPNTPSWKTPGQNTFYTFRNAEKGTDAKGNAITLANPVANGARLRWTAHAWWTGGPLAFLGEYTAVTEAVSRSGVSGDWKSSAWQGALTYVIGGRPHFSGTTVTTPFRLGGDGWGAFELAARASSIATDSASYATWADPSKSARQATSFTGGVRWHLSTHYRIFLDYEHTIFSGGAASGDLVTEHAVLGRVQLAY